MMITSIELDHIDIYPSQAVYEAQFEELAARVPGQGVLEPKTRSKLRTIYSELDSSCYVFKMRARDFSTANGFESCAIVYVHWQ